MKRWYRVVYRPHSPIGRLHEQDCKPSSPSQPSSHGHRVYLNLIEIDEQQHPHPARFAYCSCQILIDPKLWELWSTMLSSHHPGPIFEPANFHQLMQQIAASSAIRSQP